MSNNNTPTYESRLRSVLEVVQAYLPPDGLSSKEAMARIVPLVDPWPEGAEPAAGQQWKCGPEFLPYHPSASHVRPDFRDGWNACYYRAMELATPTGVAADESTRAPDGWKPTADDLAHIRVWFNAVQDLNPAFLDDKDRAVMARLCNEPQQALAQDPEFVALMAMSESEIDAELRALGIDPEIAARKAGEAIAEGVAWGKRGGYVCRLCGKDTPHQHTPEEIIIFRNGVKFARLSAPPSGERPSSPAPEGEKR